MKKYIAFVACMLFLSVCSTYSYAISKSTGNKQSVAKAMLVQDDQDNQATDDQTDADDQSTDDQTDTSDQSDSDDDSYQGDDDSDY